MCDVYMEFFKEIEGYKGLYRISNYGRVISIRRHREMEQIETEYGYLKVALTDDKGKRKKILVHRLVALTFLPNPNDYPCINHKDGNKQNNHLTNLEWCNHSINNDHAYKTGLRKTRMVAQYDKGKLVGVYRNCHQASVKTGIDYHAIWYALRGIYKYACNYEWRYCKLKNK